MAPVPVTTMFNRIHMLFHQPERGWDPIPSHYAREYADYACSNMDRLIVATLENKLGGLRDKRVIDLGGGPGQYSVAFAQRGAHVLWHDVSKNYLQIAREAAAAAGVTMEFSVGHLEDSKRFADVPFDLVFCRVCWCYSTDDRRFAKLVYSLIKPGGAAYIESNTPAFARPSGLRKAQHALNSLFRVKIGHPLPPRGRIARLLQRCPFDYMELDYSSPLTDKVFLRKSHN